MNPLSPPIQEAHVYFSEVMLTEFSGQALEARDQTDPLRSDGMDQLVKSALAAPVTQKPGSAHDLEGEQVGLLREPATTKARYGSAFEGRPILRRTRSASLSTWLIPASASTRCTLRTPTPASLATSGRLWPARRNT